MCGIIHIKRKNKVPACKMVLKRFENQRSRGTDGFGFIELHNGIVGAEIRTQTEKGIKEKLLESKADEIMFHHRFPTSTPNFIEATHPILVSNDILVYDYYVMHNGVISNDDSLKKIHNEQGFGYITEIKKKYITKGQVYVSEMYNDSEALAIDFCLSLENDKEMMAEGSIALVALQFEKKSRKAVALYFGRNTGNPLKIEDGKDFISLSSQTGKDIPSDSLFRMDYKTGLVTETKKKIGRYMYDIGGYGYQYNNDDDYDDNYPKVPRTEELGAGGEDDFDMELWEELQELEEEQRKAEIAGDYDKMTELDVVIQEIKMELDGFYDDDIKAEVDLLTCKTEKMEGDIEELGVGKHLKNKKNKLGF